MPDPKEICQMRIPYVDDQTCGEIRADRDGSWCVFAAFCRIDDEVTEVEIGFRTPEQGLRRLSRLRNYLKGKKHHGQLEFAGLPVESSCIDHGQVEVEIALQEEQIKGLL